MSPRQNSSLLLNWSIPNIPILRAKALKCLEQANWQAICERASLDNGGQPCELLSDCTCGGTSLARLLEFQDGTRWVARVPLVKPTPERIQRLRTEIDTMILLRNHTKTVPQVFAFELDDAHPAGTPFVLLEFLPGNTAMDEADNYDKGEIIPRQHQQTCYQSLASAHVS